MREYGIPQVLTWRWAPFAALVLGSLSFVGFTLLAIPDHIGRVEGEATTDGLGFGNRFMRSPIKTNPGPARDWSTDDAEPSAATPVTRVATHGADMFPKRGFSPPLERTEPPPAPAPPPAPPVSMAIPPPAAEPPAPPPLPAPEVMPQPVAAPDQPVAPDAAAAAPPPPPSNN